jgi:hypothetical protein
MNLLPLGTSRSSCFAASPLMAWLSSASLCAAIGTVDPKSSVGDHDADVNQNPALSSLAFGTCACCCQLDHLRCTECGSRGQQTADLTAVPSVAGMQGVSVQARRPDPVSNKLHSSLSAGRSYLCAHALFILQRWAHPRGSCSEAPLPVAAPRRRAAPRHPPAPLLPRVPPLQGGPPLGATPPPPPPAPLLPAVHPLQGGPPRLAAPAQVRRLMSGCRDAALPVYCCVEAATNVAGMTCLLAAVSMHMVDKPPALLCVHSDWCATRLQVAASPGSLHSHTASKANCCLTTPAAVVCCSVVRRRRRRRF